MKLKNSLFVAYMLALLVWISQGVFHVAEQAYYSATGLASEQVIYLGDFAQSSLVEYTKDDKPTGYWLASSDADPYIAWYGSAYVNFIAVDIKHHKPAGSIELYYSEKNTGEFTPENVVYPTRVDDTLYFDVGGKLITALRLDTDSVGGVLTQFNGMTLNTPMPWYIAFIPSAEQMIVLLLLPLVLTAVLEQIVKLIEDTSKND